MLCYLLMLCHKPCPTGFISPAAGGATMFTFDELCNRPLGAGAAPAACQLPRLLLPSMASGPEARQTRCLVSSSRRTPFIGVQCWSIFKAL
jgi:hypothetical protein